MVGGVRRCCRGLTGGYLGAGIARRIPSTYLRTAIVLFGVLVAGALLRG